MRSNNHKIICHLQRRGKTVLFCWLSPSNLTQLDFPSTIQPHLNRQQNENTSSSLSVSQTLAPETKTRKNSVSMAKTFLTDHSSCSRKHCGHQPDTQYSNKTTRGGTKNTSLPDHEIQIRLQEMNWSEARGRGRGKPALCFHLHLCVMKHSHQYLHRDGCDLLFQRKMERMRAHTKPPPLSRPCGRIEFRPLGVRTASRHIHSNVIRVMCLTLNSFMSEN